jgi:hypothetical protein
MRERFAHLTPIPSGQCAMKFRAAWVLDPVLGAKSVATASGVRLLETNLPNPASSKNYSPVCVAEKRDSSAPKINPANAWQLLFPADHLPPFSQETPSAKSAPFLRFFIRPLWMRSASLPACDRMPSHLLNASALPLIYAFPRTSDASQRKWSSLRSASSRKPWPTSIGTPKHVRQRFASRVLRNV